MKRYAMLFFIRRATKVHVINYLKPFISMFTRIDNLVTRYTNYLWRKSFLVQVTLVFLTACVGSLFALGIFYGVVSLITFMF